MIPLRPARLSRDAFLQLRPEHVGRVVLAASGLIVLHLDPPDHGPLPALNPLLIAYLLFAVAILVQDWRGQASPHRYEWIDLGWILALIAVTGGTSSVLSFMLLLPILSRAFGGGFAAGWNMTLLATFGLLVVGLPTAPDGTEFEPNRALIRPITLLVLGYILSREGGAQQRARRHLSLLAQIKAVGNPRLGADRTLSEAARHIRQSYDVRECLILMRRADAGSPVLARADRSGTQIESLPESAVAALMALPDQLSVLLRPGRQPLRQPPDIDPGEACDALRDVLDAPALLSVPLLEAGQTVGRLFLVDARLRDFDGAELDFFRNAAAHLMLAVERIRLLDDLASVAGQRERRRLAHDLHDLAIQPYLGVQLGLSALRRRADCPPALARELDGLERLAQLGVSELRGILDTTRREAVREIAFDDALTRIITLYRTQYGIDITVQASPGLAIGDRLAGEVLALVSEALSNLRRHTPATHATIHLALEADQLLIELSNPHDGTPASAFVPRSISARILELGGSGATEADRDGHSVMTLRIPL